MQITLVETCDACPEQYDAYDAATGRQVGYLRLRHGKFTVDCPDVEGTQVYHAYPNGDGCFHGDERAFFLSEAKNAISDFYRLESNNSGKYIVAYLSLFKNELTQTLVEATSEREALLKYLAQHQDITFDESELLEMEDVDSLVEQCYNMDSHISAYKLD